MSRRASLLLAPAPDGPSKSVASLPSPLSSPPSFQCSRMQRCHTASALHEALSAVPGNRRPRRWGTADRLSGCSSTYTRVLTVDLVLQAESDRRIETSLSYLGARSGVK